ncbi:DUF6961 family protein [Sphingobium sp. CAP-1]|uniref:DUF6961 family protein n=1 Tax=Sphingobium sp. CAP-1 TaxID=2676077 RepID=UPI0012BB2F6A|nr:hypothetical protein [Sphingobium sp. CAP-1]QGP77780.1 hypothetical protein GL174_01295 [Sphingobium sp. CAP-1]
MTRDQELWGVAGMMLNRHGPDAPVKVAERLGALAMAGEAEGVAMWQEVARRLQALMADQHHA